MAGWRPYTSVSLLFRLDVASAFPKSSSSGQAASCAQAVSAASTAIGVHCGPATAWLGSGGSGGGGPGPDVPAWAPVDTLEAVAEAVLGGACTWKRPRPTSPSRHSASASESDSVRSPRCATRLAGTTMGDASSDHSDVSNMAMDCVMISSLRQDSMNSSMVMTPSWFRSSFRKTRSTWSLHFRSSSI